MCKFIKPRFSNAKCVLYEEPTPLSPPRGAGAAVTGTLNLLLLFHVASGLCDSAASPALDCWSGEGKSSFLRGGFVCGGILGDIRAWGDTSAPSTPSPAKAGARESFLITVGDPGRAGGAGGAK